MKFLLTSAGITNPSIAKAVVDLVGKPANNISLVFIPTAANLIAEDKGWLIDNLNDLKKQGYLSIDILDIAGTPKDNWLPRLESADLICFGGGNEQYLAKVMRESGMDATLADLLKSRVYMGISAGSMVVGQFLPESLMKVVYPEEVFDSMAPSLALVDLLFIPHLNSPYFMQARRSVLDNLKNEITHPLYACDDRSALKVIDGKIEIVSEGEVVVL
ncbi:MAG: Type 1 glutamine amidotransferase-like domain-containing protein [Minisyncoccia bacterium]